MHYLHRILVYIPDCCELKTSRKEKIKEIRCYAESMTEEYDGPAFDWRETETAGRWADEYPQQVYFAADNIEWFEKELKDVQMIQKHEAEKCLAEIKTSVGTDLEKIYKILSERKMYFDEQTEKKVSGCDRYMVAYYLHHLSEILHGDYCSNSYFYDTHEITASLYDSKIEQIKAEPQNWALVMFDYHN